MNVFESIVYVMIVLDKKIGLDNLIKEKYFELITDNDFLDNIANHRDSANKYEKRKDIIKTKFKEVMFN